jgi:hypothetical protein
MAHPRIRGSPQRILRSTVRLQRVPPSAISQAIKRPLCDVRMGCEIVAEDASLTTMPLPKPAQQVFP